MLCLLCSIHRSAFTSFTTTTHSACPSHFGPASTVACASIILFFSLARHPLWLTFQLSRPVVEARAPEYPENNTVQHLALAALTCQYHQRALVSQGSLPRSAGSSYLTPWSVERALLFTQYQHYPLSSITFTSVTPFPICCRRQSCSLASCILHLASCSASSHLSIRCSKPGRTPTQLKPDNIIPHRHVQHSSTPCSVLSQSECTDNIAKGSTEELLQSFR